MLDQSIADAAPSHYPAQITERLYIRASYRISLYIKRLPYPVSMISMEKYATPSSATRDPWFGTKPIDGREALVRPQYY